MKDKVGSIRKYGKVKNSTEKLLQIRCCTKKNMGNIRQETLHQTLQSKY